MAAHRRLDRRRDDLYAVGHHALAIVEIIFYFKIRGAASAGWVLFDGIITLIQTIDHPLAFLTEPTVISEFIV